MLNGLGTWAERGYTRPTSATNLLTRLRIDEVFTRSDSNGAMSFLTDALGSTLALTDSGGGINTSYTYEPFGHTTVTGSNGNPYQFTGRENDGTALYFYRNRYYSPTYQRFIAQDPMGFSGRSTNLYTYAFNDPLYYIDPFGTCPWWVVYGIPEVADVGGEVVGNAAGEIAAPESIIGGHLLGYFAGTFLGAGATFLVEGLCEPGPISPSSQVQPGLPIFNPPLPLDGMACT